jgi:hypothetical protein
MSHLRNSAAWQPLLLREVREVWSSESGTSHHEIRVRERGSWEPEGESASDCGVGSGRSPASAAPRCQGRERSWGTSDRQMTCTSQEWKVSLIGDSSCFGERDSQKLCKLFWESTNDNQRWLSAARSLWSCAQDCSHKRSCRVVGEGAEQRTRSRQVEMLQSPDT